MADQKDIRRRMSEAHEAYLQERLGGHRMPGSGNQFSKQMDGRHDHREDPYAFAWDAKATLGDSLPVTRSMWRKAVEQAGGERPCLPLRWYDTDRLDVGADLIAVDIEDFIALRDEATVLAEVCAIFEREAAVSTTDNPDVFLAHVGKMAAEIALKTIHTIRRGGVVG